ncbi:GAF domain-containing protein [Tardiphaga alba]|uniref:GAF domain-containing protein n=1 Tax=Tardiphaga alba TaxID=340268 RepID=A0ABX8A3C3_9BRAD|nr:AAA family ATPase [Tardiphaga alba]QUS38053.1 GAF domain-containing protein [Tardiphaga alba]
MTTWIDEADRLYDDEGVVVYRRRAGDRTPAQLIKTTTHGLAASEQRRRLVNEFTIASEFGDEWSVKPTELTEDEARVTLFLNDPGGHWMTVRPGEQRSLSEFLTIAIAVADALAQLHNLNIIHRDIRPSSLMVNRSGAVHLANFEYSSRETAADRAFAVPPNTNRVAYLSPEATGKANRSIDKRSDLYSLGITLYELLTGRMPFAARSLSQWIDAHMAREPMPPGAFVRNLPAPVAEIILKLLAKEPEDRYQTASGLRADLSRCLDDLTASGDIYEFQIALDDTPNQLYVSEKLYGRRVEVARLLAVYEGLADRGLSDFVLVSGVSGVGKSAIIAEVQKRLVVSDALFAIGKCEQSRSNAPYATLTIALDSFFTGINSRGEGAIAPWRRNIEAALGPNARLVTDLVPSLGMIIGPQNAVPALPAREASYRFHTVMKRLFSALANASHPFVLFIDDMQWIDGGTLELLSSLIVDPEVRYLLLLGAYRANENNAQHPLSDALARIAAAGSVVQELPLSPLKLEHTVDFTVDCVRRPREEVRDLAQFIHDASGGNPFFSKQLIRTLADEGSIKQDDRSRKWEWHIQSMRSATRKYVVDELLKSRLETQGNLAKRAIETLACLGVSADINNLGEVLHLPPDDVDSILSDIVRIGLVLRVGRRYVFVHDKVQEAAYGLIAPSERSGRHIEIARGLISALSVEPSTERVFEAVDQLNLGKAHVVDPAERLLAAGLNLQAAKSAKASSAHASYHQYLRAGADFLPRNAWEEHPDVAFQFAFHLSESEFLLGDLASSEQRLLDLNSRSLTLSESGSVAWLLTTCLTTSGQLDRAVEVCLTFLRRAGINWSPHPTGDDLLNEFVPIREEIQAGLIDRRSDLRELNDPVQRIVLDVLTAVLPPAFFTDNNLVCLVLCRMANISRNYGNSDASGLGYAYLGMTLGPTFNQWRAGYSFGEMGFKLSNDRPTDPFKARVQMAFCYHVMPYSRPIRETWRLHREAFDLAKDCGDLNYTGFSSCTLISSFLFSGVHLEEVQSLANDRLQFVAAVKFGLIEEIISTQLRLVRAYRGDLDAFPSMDDSDFNELAYERYLKDRPELAIATCWYWIRKLELRVVGCDYEGALEASRAASALVWTSGGHLELTEFYFYSGLACAGAATPSAIAEFSFHTEQLSLCVEKLRVLAYHCPENFGARSTLLEAELKRVQKQPLAALQLYENAIEQSRIEGFAHIEAMSHEAAARLYDTLGLGSAKDVHIAAARDCYLKYGATAKAGQLEEGYPGSLLPGGSSAARLRDSGDAYFNAVLATSEAVSEGVDIDALVGTLLTSIIQSAGADRVLLLLPNGDGLRLEAEATCDGADVKVSIHRAEFKESHAPAALIGHVAATRSMINVPDVRAGGEYQSDQYLTENGIRSLICIPLSKHARLIGVLYLESRSEVRIFIDARVRLLQLISTLVAVALENASLEEKESLLREVHHRVKNNLQLITSLLNLQADRASDPEVAELFEESRNRIRAMALVHENLYRAGNLARISMRQHIESLCSQLFRVYGTNQQRISLELGVDDIQLDLDRAIACGLLVNELVSNSLKHAFVDDREGKVKVSLRSRADGHLELKVEDDGVGFVVFDGKKRSLGLQLVEDLAHQLRATLETQSSAGVVTLLRFSLSGEIRDTPRRILANGIDVSAKREPEKSSPSPSAV